MLTDLKKWLKAEQQDKDIFDIILYGSAVKGKENPRDIDIVILFRKGTLKERLEKIQTIKKKIQLEQKVDIKGVLWEELFQAEFFARSGIYIEGISIFDGKPFAQKIGFIGFALFVYSLQDKSHTEKVKFNYVLGGRGMEGMIASVEGQRIAPGVILIPIKHSAEFEAVLQRHHIQYSKKQVLVEQ